MAQFRCMGCMEEHDDQRGICPNCGYVVNTAVSEPYFLIPQTILNSRYVVGKVLGSGKSTITYIGYDNQEMRKVVIREYMPIECSNRMIGTTDVVPYDGERADRYEKGLRGFIEEFEQAFELNNSLDGVVDIYECFIENNTAYIVMEHVDGLSLEDLVKKSGRLSCDDVVQVMLPVLNSIDVIHSQGCFYYDITPDTIVMTRDRKVKLIGMGVKNPEGVTGNNENLAKSGFSPEELYRKNGKIGPWTDLYAIAATIYYTVTGIVPMNSLERKDNDKLMAPSEMGIKISRNKENALMNALNIYMEDRTKSVKIFAEALSGQRRVERIIVKKRKEDVGKWSLKTKLFTAGGIVVALALIATIVLSTTPILSNKSNDKTMIELDGLTLEKAKEKLKKLDMEIEVVGQIDDDKEKDANIIIWQDIQPGSKIGEDEKIVEVKVSTGEREEGIMPNLIGLSQEEADKRLKDAGIDDYKIKYDDKTSYHEKETDEFDEGLVCGQSIEEGTEFISVDEYEKLTIYIAKAKPTTTRYVAPQTQAPTYATAAPTQAPTYATAAPTTVQTYTTAPPTTVQTYTTAPPTTVQTTTKAKDQNNNDNKNNESNNDAGGRRGEVNQ